MCRIIRIHFPPCQCISVPFFLIISVVFWPCTFCKTSPAESFLLSVSVTNHSCQITAFLRFQRRIWFNETGSTDTLAPKSWPPAEFGSTRVTGGALLARFTQPTCRQQHKASFVILATLVVNHHRPHLGHWSLTDALFPLYGPCYERGVCALYNLRVPV